MASIGQAVQSAGKEDKARKKMVERAARTARKNAQKAHTRDSLQALSKLAEVVDGKYRIISQPPIVIPARDLGASFGMSGDDLQAAIH